MNEAIIRETVVMILAGGQGERLYPLTRHRAKPAVPFAGAYRIIDFTLSNCINSTLTRIFLLTQYRSVSLHRHVQAGWSSFVVPALGQFIDLVPPQQRTQAMWYRGTADAIYQNIYLLDQERPRYVLILSGDHVYSMDYRQMIAQHEETGADLTIGCIEVPREEAKRFGVMEVDASLRIRSFAEKPADPKPIPGKPDRSLASMGIYVFTTETLVRSLIADARRADSQHDFGKNVIPALVEGNARVYAHPFHEPGRPENNYWRDIGTLESYYAANMDLLEPEPPFRLDDPDWPVRTYYLPAPPARVVSEGQEAVVENSMLSPGAVVRGATVRRSILGPNVVLEPGAVVEDSLIFEGTRVGKGAQVRRTIIDKQVVVPPGDRIGGQPRDRSRGFKITESGLVVIPKGMVLA